MEETGGKEGRCEGDVCEEIGSVGGEEDNLYAASSTSNGFVPVKIMSSSTPKCLLRDPVSKQTSRFSNSSKASHSQSSSPGTPYLHHQGQCGNGEQGLATLDDTRSWLTTTELEIRVRQQAHEREREAMLEGQIG